MNEPTTTPDVESDDIPKQYLTTPEAAAFLRLQPQTLIQWRVSGKGPEPRNHGRLVLYDIDDLRAWSNSQRKGSKSSEAAA